jgi:hypothetical protein
MKLLALFIFLFAGSISLFAASEGSGLNLSRPTSAAPASSSQDGYRLTRKSVESSTCYKMRAYYVVRDSRNPDVTRSDGYSTCQPAARFQVKRAIEHWTEQRMIEDRHPEPESILPQ